MNKSSIKTQACKYLGYEKMVRADFIFKQYILCVFVLFRFTQLNMEFIWTTTLQHINIILWTENQKGLFHFHPCYRDCSNMS